MDTWFLAALFLLLLIVVGAVLGIIAFFSLRKLRDQNALLQRDLKAVQGQMEAFAAQAVGAAASFVQQARADIAPSIASETVSAQNQDLEEQIAPATAAAFIGPVLPKVSQAAAVSAAPPPLPTGADTPTDAPTGAPADIKTRTPVASKLDAESTIGGKITIWVGGLALGFGGLFLVLYAIENAILGPAARVSLGFGFGALVAALGEWTRRRPEKYALAGFERANIPAILTSVGIFSMFAAVYAAHGLYELIGPVMAFAILAALSAAVMALALLHGPTLGALGLLASYGVPFLITSNADSVTGLASYILAVTMAALTVARLRGWLWLAQSALAASFFFGILFQMMGTGDPPLVVTLYIAATCVLAFFTFVYSIHTPLAFGQKSDDSARPPTDWLATRALAVMPLPIIMHFHQSQPLGLEVLEMAALFAVPMAVAYVYPALRFVIVLPAIAACLRYLTMSLPALDVPLETLLGPSLLSMDIRASIPVYASIGALSVLALLVWSLWAALRSPTRTVMVATGAFSAVLMLFVAFGRLDMFFGVGAFTFAALMLFALFHIQASRLHQGLGVGVYGRDASIASALIGSLVALAFAATVLFDGVGLTLALGLITGASVITYQRYPLMELRVFAVLALLPYVGRLIFEPLIDPALMAVSPPFFNLLALGYGIPALSLVACAFVLTAARKDIWAELMQGAAIVLVLVSVAVLCLHAIDPTFRFFTGEQSLAATATLTMIGGAFALGLTRITSRGGAMRVLSIGAQILGGLGMAFGAVSLFVVYNPVFHPSAFTNAQINVGQSVVFNLIGYAYALPGLIFGALVYQVWGKRHRAYCWGALIFTGLLGFVWVNLTIRQVFSPGLLLAAPIEQGELYTYSVVWLIIAIAMLAYGILARQVQVRAASGLILVAVILKVFLLDLSHLTGILRAVSFIGLGAVLLCIGLVYQRALRTLQTREAPNGDLTDDEDRQKT